MEPHLKIVPFADVPLKHEFYCWTNAYFGVAYPVWQRCFKKGDEKARVIGGPEFKILPSHRAWIVDEEKYQKVPFDTLRIGDHFYCYFESADGITVWIANSKTSNSHAVSEYGKHDFEPTAEVAISLDRLRSL